MGKRRAQPEGRFRRIFGRRRGGRGSQQASQLGVLCLRCGYDLRGQRPDNDTMAVMCPECGRPWTVAQYERDVLAIRGIVERTHDMLSMCTCGATAWALFALAPGPRPMWSLLAPALLFAGCCYAYVVYIHKVPRVLRRLYMVVASHACMVVGLVGLLLSIQYGTATDRVWLLAVGLGFWLVSMLIANRCWGRVSDLSIP